MNAKDAAKLINQIRPEVAIPTHYGSIVGKSEDADTFRKFVDQAIVVETRLYDLRRKKAMKEKISITEYANLITEALPKGILLNTNGDKFNSMVIGWGHIGTLWGLPTFVVYVRQSRYTKGQIDKTGEFTVSVPMDGIVPAINKVCGSQSGFDVDKVKEAGLTVAEPVSTGTPGIKEYPLTIECKVLYSQDQDADKIPGDIIKRYYPETAPGQCDFHSMYVGQVVDTYIIR